MSLRSFFGEIFGRPPATLPVASVGELLCGRKDQEAGNHSALGGATPTRPLQPPTERDVRIVRDMSQHVMSKVAPIVAMHGNSMENSLQANVLAVEVALRLALEAAQRTALTALMKGSSLDDALGKMDEAIAIICEGLAAHRAELAAAIEATHLGLRGGQVRP